MIADADQPDDEAWWIARNFIAAICYLLLCIVSVALLVKNVLYYSTILGIPQRFFLVLTSIQTAVRCIYFLLSAAEYYVELDGVALNICASIPASLYFTTFSILLYSWFQVFLRTNSAVYEFTRNPTRALLVFCTVMNGLFYINVIVHFALRYSLDDYSQSELAYSYILASFSLVLALAFLACGYVYWMFKRSNDARRQVNGDDVLRLVSYISLGCVIGFIFRSIIIFTYTTSIGSHYAASICYYFLSELIPIAMMLYFFHKIQEYRFEPGQSVRYGSIASPSTPSTGLGGAKPKTKGPITVKPYSYSSSMLTPSDTDTALLSKPLIETAVDGEADEVV